MKETKEILSDLMYIKGVGPKKAEAFAEEGIITQKDLVMYLPKSYIDRESATPFAKIKSDLLYEEQDETQKILGFVFKREITAICRITHKSIYVYGKNRKLLSITLTDGSNTPAKLVFFNMVEYFDKIYSVDSVLVVSGMPELDPKGMLTFSHPEIEIIEQEEAEEYSSGKILPKYRISEKMRRSGINLPNIRKIIKTIFERGDFHFRETLDFSVLDRFNLPPIRETVHALHFPANMKQLELARYRVKFEELLHYQLLISMKKNYIKQTEKGIVIDKKSSSARKLFKNLPFELTQSQKRVLREIDADFRSGKNMNRLLQGDVGSGKTIVAIFTMLMAIDAGLQVAFMAPTEILAEQHYFTLKNYFEKNFAGEIKIVQLVGGQRTKLRREVLEEIQSGRANVIVGTHALFQNEIEYRRLGYVIIDEQHRFGVAQRAELIRLAAKSFDEEHTSPHILVMSATPIPRTLTMTVYGDLEVSIIDEMPKNRKPIKTKVQFDEYRDAVYEHIRSELKAGRQAYIVFPLVEKSEKLELKAATEHFEIIKEEIFPDFKCGLLHGQMHWYEKEAAMNSFLNKEFDILVSTTVIEVGIDVPNASVMLIENAERFGLSQLHQLRGRVGRGSDQSYCILMTKDNFKYKMKTGLDGENERISAVVRLKTMERTTDGFEISEVDMKLRGPGDMLGTRQAGLPEFKYADLIKDKDIIITAKSIAEEIVEEDPQLKSDKYMFLRQSMAEKHNIDKTYLGIA